MADVTVIKVAFHAACAVCGLPVLGEQARGRLNIEYAVVDVPHICGGWCGRVLQALVCAGHLN